MCRYFDSAGEGYGEFGGAGEMWTGFRSDFVEGWVGG